MFLFAFNLVGLFLVGFIASSPIAIPLALVFYYRDEKMIKKYVDEDDPSAGYRTSPTHPIASAIRALFTAYAICLGLLVVIFIAINVF